MRFIFALFVAIIVFGCQPLTDAEKHFGGRLDGEISPGFSYINHTKNQGNKCAPGEYAYFNYYITAGDSLLYTNVKLGKPEKVAIPLDINQVPAPMRPVVKALKEMTIGDSLSVLIPIDSFPSKPQGFEVPYVTQTYILTNIKDEATFQADLAAERAVQEAKVAEGKKREAVISVEVSDRAKEYAAGKLDAQITTTPSGLKYIIHEEGPGAKPTDGNTVLVQYFGALTDGTPFDNSFKRGQPFNFPLGQGRVIKGWDEGIALLNEGSKATFFIPHHLAYGERGSPPLIPAKAELIFYVELENANAK